MAHSENGDSMPSQFASRAWKLFATHFENSRRFAFEKVIDFGCGNGDTTFRLSNWIEDLNHKAGHHGLRPFIVGVDVCPANVAICQNRNSESNDDELNFKEADLGDASTLSPEWESAFDLATSFMSAHWINDQTQVLRNIWFCLKPGGYFFLYCPTGLERVPENDGISNGNFSTDQVVKLKYNAYTIAGQRLREKWGRWLPEGGMCEVLFPGLAAFHPWAGSDPARGFAQLVVDAGFDILEARNAVFDFVCEDDADLVDDVASFCPKMELLEAEDRVAFARDFVEEFKKICRWKEIEEGEKKILLDTSVIVVIGRKV